jgi:hypothetical protein
MKFTDRREFLYDPEIFKRYDTQTALKFHDEAVRKHAARPFPIFYEVERNPANIDPLWREPNEIRTTFSRQLEVPAIVQPEKLRWSLSPQGRVPRQRYKFWTSNLILQSLNYFGLPGDKVYWNGYRLEITTIEFEPNSYWQQTNVWLGLIYVAELVPEGDAKPMINPGVLAPVEKSNSELPVPINPAKPVSNKLPSDQYKVELPK